jgi:hypothetical protein
MKIILLFAVTLMLSINFVNAQPQKSANVSTKPASSKVLQTSDLSLAVSFGEVDRKTYRNKFFNFAIEFPQSWRISDDDLEDFLKTNGLELNLQTPTSTSANPSSQSKLNAAASRVSNLTTAFKLLPGTKDNAVFSISIESLEDLPQVKDAVDYIDLLRETILKVKVPKGFKYSETQAEKLGRVQFAFLDTSSAIESKRMYCIVKNGFAVLFTLSYNTYSDLELMKKILANGDFSLK